MPNCLPARAGLGPNHRSKRCWRAVDRDDSLSTHRVSHKSRGMAAALVSDRIGAGYSARHREVPCDTTTGANVPLGGRGSAAT